MLRSQKSGSGQMESGKDAKRRRVKEVEHGASRNDIAAIRRSAYLTVDNRNMHTHQATCVEGKSGISGCRFSVPYEHDIPESRVVELDPMMLEVE